MSSGRAAAFTRRAAGKLTGAGRRGVALGLSLPPLRRRLTRRARAAWATCEPVTFVCLGNIYRSPFAERVARQRLDRACRVASAGTFDRPGRHSPPAAVSAARRWGVDLEEHRSRVLDASMVRDAGSIFVFDVGNLLRLWHDFPESRGRVHMLAALADEGQLAISDPYGGPEEELTAVYARIAQLIAGAGGPGGESEH